MNLLHFYITDVLQLKAIRLVITHFYHKIPIPTPVPAAKRATVVLIARALFICAVTLFCISISILRSQ